jgi:hypothetical protein
VGQITLDLEPDLHPEDINPEVHHVLDTILGFSMQQISAANSSEQQQQQQQQRPPFALRSFSSSVLHGSEVLAALPAATLTSLTCLLLEHEDSDRDTAVPAALAGALAGLTNLRCLQLDGRILGAWLASVAADISAKLRNRCRAAAVAAAAGKLGVAQPAKLLQRR